MLQFQALEISFWFGENIYLRFQSKEIVSNVLQHMLSIAPYIEFLGSTISNPSYAFSFLNSSFNGQDSIAFNSPSKSIKNAAIDMLALYQSKYVPCLIYILS